MYTLKTTEGITFIDTYTDIVIKEYSPEKIVFSYLNVDRTIEDPDFILKFVYETCKKLDYNPFIGLDIDKVCDNVKNFSKTIMNTLYKIDWTLNFKGTDTYTLIRSERLEKWLKSIDVKIETVDREKGRLILAIRKTSKKVKRTGSYKFTKDFDLERDLMKLILRTYD